MPSLRVHFTDPRLCWRRFTLGLMIFIMGAGLLLGTAHYHAILYWLSVLVLAVGFFLAMSGYLGIFIQRFSGLNTVKKQSRGDGD